MAQAPLATLFDLCGHVTSGVPGGQRVPQDATEQMAAILGFRMSRVTSPRQLLLLVLFKLQNVRLGKKTWQQQNASIFTLTVMRSVDPTVSGVTRSPT